MFMCVNIYTCVCIYVYTHIYTYINIEKIRNHSKLLTAVVLGGLELIQWGLRSTSIMKFSLSKRLIIYNICLIWKNKYLGSCSFTSDM